MENCAIEVLGFGENIIQEKMLYGILMIWVLEFRIVFSRKILWYFDDVSFRILSRNVEPPVMI